MTIFLKRLFSLIFLSFLLGSSATYASSKSDQLIAAEEACKRFSTLGVELREPHFNLHNFGNAVEPIIQDLETICSSMEGVERYKDLRFSFKMYSALFPKDCIPKAEICELLMVAYGGRTFYDDYSGILGQMKIEAEVYAPIRQHAYTAFISYFKALEGSTTEDERLYFNTRLINIYQSLQRQTLYAQKTDGDREDLACMLEGAQEAALFLGRYHRDKAIDSLRDAKKARWTFHAYRAAQNFLFSGDTHKARKYAQKVVDFVNEAEEAKEFYGDPSFWQNLRVKAGEILVRLDNPDGILKYQADHLDVYLR